MLWTIFSHVFVFLAGCIVGAVALLVAAALISADDLETAA